MAAEEVSIDAGGVERGWRKHLEQQRLAAEAISKASEEKVNKGVEQ